MGRKDRASEDITTLFVSGLPDDAEDSEVRAALEPEGHVTRCSLMKRGLEVVAFVRFETQREMRRAMSGIQDGKLEICGVKPKVEIARQNTVKDTRDP